MSTLAVVLLLATSQSGQIMAGHAFERFAASSERICPARRLRTINAGDLAGLQESFEARLSVARMKRLEAINHANERCAGRDGVSCPTSETLSALSRTGMIKAFTVFACTHSQR